MPSTVLTKSFVLLYLVCLAQCRPGSVQFSRLADSNSQVPKGGGSGNFTSFTFPAMDPTNAGVIFDGSGTTGVSGAIFGTIVDGSLGVLIATSNNMSALGMASANGEGVSFVASGAKGLAVYLLNATTGILTLVADQDTTIPNSGGQLFQPSFTGIPVFGGSHVTFAGGSNTLSGIYAFSASGLTRIADTTTEMPHFGGPFNCLESPSVFDGVFVFFGSQCTTTNPLMGPLMGNNMLKTRRVASHAIKSRSGRGVPAGVYIMSNGTLAVMADSSMKLPGTTSGEKFEAFGSPQVSNNQAAFVALGDQSTMGIYVYDFATGKLRVVADTNTAVPQGTGTFADFPEDPSISAHNVAFFAMSEAGIGGIYLSTVDAGTHGQLERVLDSTQQMMGLEIIYLGFGSAALAPLASGAERMAFYAVLSDNSDGIYTADYMTSSR